MRPPRTPMAMLLAAACALSATARAGILDDAVLRFEGNTSLSNNGTANVWTNSGTGGTNYNAVDRAPYGGAVTQQTYTLQNGVSTAQRMVFDGIGSGFDSAFQGNQLTNLTVYAVVTRTGASALPGYQNVWSFDYGVGGWSRGVGFTDGDLVVQTKTPSNFNTGLGYADGTNRAVGTSFAGNDPQTINAYVNGGTIAGPSGLAAAANNNGSLNIGYTYDGGSTVQFLNGTVSALLMWTNQLSASERTEVERYLSKTYVVGAGISTVLTDNFDSPTSSGGLPISGPTALTNTGWVTTGNASYLPGQEDDPGQPQRNTESQFAYLQAGDAIGNLATTMRKDTGVAAEANTAYTVTLFNGKRNDFASIITPFQVQLYAGDPGADGTGGTLIGTTTVTQTTNNALGYTVGRFATGGTAPSGNVYARIALPANAAAGTGYTQLLVDSLAIEKSPGIFNESFDRGGGGNGQGGIYTGSQALANNGWQYTLAPDGAGGAAPGQESSPSTQPTPDSGANWGFLSAFGGGGQKIWMNTGHSITNGFDSYRLQFYSGGKNESTYNFTGTLTASLWVGDPNGSGIMLGSGIAINPAAGAWAFNSFEITNAAHLNGDLYVQFETSASGNGSYQQALIDSVVVQIDPNTPPPPVTYSSWAAANVGGQPADAYYNGGAIPNGVRYFMNAAPDLTVGPGLVGNAVTWTNGGNIPPSAYGTQFAVQTSTDLAAWIDVPSNAPNLLNTTNMLTWLVPSLGNGNMGTFIGNLPAFWSVFLGTLASAQSTDNSSFTNQFADNASSWLIDDSTDASGSAGFFQAFSADVNYAWLAVNFDFKITQLTGATWGIQFDGAGASALASSSVHYRVDEVGQFAINAGPGGGAITNILTLEPDKWYNVRAVFTTTARNTGANNGAGVQSGTITPAGGAPVSWTNVPLLDTSLGFSRVLVRDRSTHQAGDLLLDNMAVRPMGKQFIRLKVTPD